MQTCERLRDMRNLDHVLGILPEDPDPVESLEQVHYDSRRAPLPPVEGMVTGYVEMDLK